MAEDKRKASVEMSEERKVSIVQGQILEHSHDADEALKALGELDGEPIELDEATHRQLLRKIDWNLMPMLCVVYMLNYLDKTSLSYASVMGLKTDANLTGTQYSWLVRSTRDPNRDTTLIIRTGIDLLLWLSWLGISNEPTATATTPRQILGFQHYSVGSYPDHFCRG